MSIAEHQRISLVVSQADIEQHCVGLAKAFEASGWKWHGKRGKPGYYPEPGELAEAVRDLKLLVRENEGMMGIGGISLQRDCGQYYLCAAPEIVEALARLQPEEVGA